MKIFQLTPIKPEENERAWLSSTTKEPLVVRAESEKRARQLAAFATGIAKEISTKNHNSPLSPWYSDKHASCVDYVGKQYQVEGNEEILSPIELQKELEAIKNNNKV